MKATLVRGRVLNEMEARWRPDLGILAIRLAQFVEGFGFQKDGDLIHAGLSDDETDEAGRVWRRCVECREPPLANLHLTLLDRMGVPTVERIGDSTGRLEHLSFN